METTARSVPNPGGAVRLNPRPFHAWRDGIVAVVFVVVIAGCVTAAIVWGHASAVLGTVYATVAFLVWIEAFRSTWAVGSDELASRRWYVWRTLRADHVTDVAIDPGEPGVDLSINGGGLHRFVVPLDDWRRRADAVDRLAEFVANAQRHGAHVDDAVWHALRRPA